MTVIRRMVVISGGTTAVGAIACAIAGAGGLYVVLKWANGGEDFPSISNSMIGFQQWEHKAQTNLIGLDFDFHSGGILFEVGMILTFAGMAMCDMCCGVKSCRSESSELIKKEEKHVKRRLETGDWRL